jgi:hypothetical protein
MDILQRLKVIGVAALLATVWWTQSATVVIGPPVSGGGGTTGGGGVIPTFVRAGDSNAVQATSITVTLPPHSANDVFVIPVLDGSGQVISCPTGWSEIGPQVSDSVNLTASFWWSRATTGSETNPQFSVPVSADCLYAGGVIVITNAITSGNPFEDVTITAVSSTTTPQTSAIDTTGANRLGIALMCQDNNLTPWNGHPPSGWTNMYNAADSSTGVGADARVAAMYRGQASAGTIAAVTVGTLNSAEEAATATFAVKPN